MKKSSVILALSILILSGLFSAGRAQEGAERLIITPENASRVTLLAKLPSWGAVDWSPDGTTLAMGRLDGIRLYDLDNLEAPPVVVFGAFYAITYRSDGILLGLERRDGCIKYDSNGIAQNSGVFDLIDVQSGDRLVVMNIDTDFSSLFFSPDGTMLALGDNYNKIQLWNLILGEHVGTLVGHNAPPTVLDFSPDNRLLASATGDGDNFALLWDVATGTLIREFSADQSGVWELEFSRNGQYVVSKNGFGETVMLWDVDTLLVEPFMPSFHLTSGVTQLQDRPPGTVYDIAFSPDGLMLATAGSDLQPWEEEGTVRLWDIRTGAQLAEWHYPDVVSNISFSPDGTLIATADWGYDALQLWGIAEE